MHRNPATRAALLVCALAALIAVLPQSLRPVAAQAGAGTIAYVRADTLDEIRLMASDGSNDRQLWTHGQADPENVHEIYSMAWRPDGGELTFASTHESACSLNNADIFVIGADGAGYRRITEAPACAELAGYPKGTVQVPVRNTDFESFVGFIYFQGAPGVQMVSLAPGGSSVVTFNDVADFGDEVLQVAVLIQGASRNIEIGTAVDVQPGGTVQTGTMSAFSLSMANVWEAHSPTWRSDGSKVGYVFNYNGILQLAPRPSPLEFGENLQTDQSQLPDFVDLLAWGPSSRANQLLYAGNVVFESEGIYLMTEGSATAGEKLVSYESYQNVRGLAWLPDGSGFVYSVAEEFGDEKANVFLYTFESRQSRRLTNFSGDFAGQLSVSPDNQWIVFERSASAEEDAATDLWLIKRDGSGLRRLAQNAARPAWSQRQEVVFSNRVYFPLVSH